MDRNAVLWMHVPAGLVAWVPGAIALWRNLPGRRSLGTLAVFHWSVLAVAITAAALVMFQLAQWWWLWLLAAFSCGLALLGYLAPRERSPLWLRLGVHGQGGACIALVTATFLVSVAGLARVAAWALPTLVGVPLLELWYRCAAAARPKAVQP